MEAVVSDVLPHMSEAEKDEIRSLERDDLAGLHLTLGMAIRNNYGLWKGNQASLECCQTDNPDDASSVIVQKLWEALTLHRNCFKNVPKCLTFISGHPIHAQAKRIFLILSAYYTHSRSHHRLCCNNVLSENQ